ncbi:tetratricopeptide repeat protein [Aquimarina sp. 2201CG5-10]|uniref:tetratricopeptide repeat protein n=1 Tax=Aquimarina callyspongiae TaxID=3098150 RepID=UPI002AB4326E|nr:tetratricopeptide repeat protein [Aquimarina sp. 2201CG5-10]MDY8136934.1 tetratricopeptide repeat protein [Aquimarina sp. 2201CG5-10]
MKEIKDKDILLITRYFDLDLSEKEMKEFDQKLQHDSIFASKVNKYQNSIDLVNKSYRNTDQEARNKKWKELITETQTSNNTVYWKWIAGIAATIVLLVSFWYFQPSLQKNDLDELTKQAWNKKVGFSDYSVRNNTDINPKQIVTNAFKAYEKKDYQSALEILEKYVPPQSYYEDALLIRALSIYKMGKPKEAIQLLNSLVNYPTGRLSKEAQWYKGLIYLDLNDIESAKKHLELPNNNNSEIQLKE